MANKNNKIWMIILVISILIGLLTTSILPFLQSWTPTETKPVIQPINVETLPSLDDLEKNTKNNSQDKNEIMIEPNTDLLPELPTDYKEPTQEELEAFRKEYQAQ